MTMINGKILHDKLLLSHRAYNANESSVIVKMNLNMFEGKQLQKLATPDSFVSCRIIFK